MSVAVPTELQVAREKLLELYSMLITIRSFEEKVADLVEAGEIHTPCHLYIGQEAIATGVCAALNKDDTVWGGHRSHGHYLAKGGDLQAMMSEIFGRATGCSKGRGGSMHIYAPEVGVLGTVPLVAATIPLAVGAGFASHLSKTRHVAVAFFGDGATEEGHFHESLNLAAKFKLPVIFVCENNFYASHLGLLERRSEDNIDKSGGAHGLFSQRLDGNDVVAVFEAAQIAVQRARSGAGPTLLECRTFRWRGHVGPSWDMDVGVKRKDELREWLEKDPIKRLRLQLEQAGVTSAWFSKMEDSVKGNVNRSVENARQSPFPQAHEVLEHIFVEKEGHPPCA